MTKKIVLVKLIKSTLSKSKIEINKWNCLDFMLNEGKPD